MGKENGVAIIYPFSVLLGILSDIFGSIKISYIILIILISIDTISGIASAIKFRRFSSKGMLKITRKIILYTTSIVTVRLFEVILKSLINTTMLSQTITAFLAITEVVSILENMIILGAPIPSNIISIMLNSLKIPNVGTAISVMTDNDKDINQIDEMLEYQVSTFQNKEVRELLNIKLNVWKSIAQQINTVKENDSEPKDVFYFRIMSLIELGFKELKVRYKEANISDEFINTFNTVHIDKVNDWLKKIETICYSDASENKKKEQLIDSLLIILYETIIDIYKAS